MRVPHTVLREWYWLLRSTVRPLFSHPIPRPFAAGSNATLAHLRPLTTADADAKTGTPALKRRSVGLRANIRPLRTRPNSVPARLPLSSASAFRSRSPPPFPWLRLLYSEGFVLETPLFYRFFEHPSLSQPISLPATCNNHTAQRDPSAAFASLWLSRFRRPPPRQHPSACGPNISIEHSPGETADKNRPASRRELSQSAACGRACLGTRESHPHQPSGP